MTAPKTEIFPIAIASDMVVPRRPEEGFTISIDATPLPSAQVDASYGDNTQIVRPAQEVASVVENLGVVGAHGVTADNWHAVLNEQQDGNVVVHPGMNQVVEAASNEGGVLIAYANSAAQDSDRNLVLFTHRGEGEQDLGNAVPLAQPPERLVALSEVLLDAGSPVFEPLTVGSFRKARRLAARLAFFGSRAKV